MRRMIPTLAVSVSIALPLLAAPGEGEHAGAPEHNEIQTVDLSQGIPEEWLETRPMPRARFRKMIDNPAPEIEALRWLNTPALSTKSLEGSIVLLYFWTPDCETCAEIVEDLNALHELYAEDGLVVLGVCMSYAQSGFEQAVKDRGMAFPVCLDRVGNTARSYKTDGTPDFYLIDREGDLRIADMHDHAVMPAVMSMLKEDEDKDAAATD